MVFVSNGFAVGSFGYDAMTLITGLTILACVASFVVLLVFEVYRAVKYAAVHDLAREAEVGCLVYCRAA